MRYSANPIFATGLAGRDCQLSLPGPQPISSTSSVCARAIRSTVRVGDWISRRTGFKSEPARFAGKTFPRPRPKALVTDSRHSRAHRSAFQSHPYPFSKNASGPEIPSGASTPGFSSWSARTPPSVLLHTVSVFLVMSYVGPRAVRSQPQVILSTPNASFTASMAVQWSLRGMFGGAGALVLLVTVIAALQPPVRAID
jgi:hypothetical protein